MWLGAHPTRIAESLLAALDTTIEPDFGYVWMDLQGEPEPVAVCHFDKAEVSPQAIGQLEEMLRQWATQHDPSEVMEIEQPERLQGLRILVQPLGFDCEFGVLAAGFSSPNEPTQFQRIVLNIAANQAIIACKNAELIHQQAVLYAKAKKEIEEREKAEAELRELTHELEAKVRERTADLEGFVYSVAHDMRQQIRSVSTKASMILEDLGDTLPEDSREDLVRMVMAARHMNELTDAILNHARMGIVEVNLRRVCLSDLAWRAWEQVATRPHCRQGTIIRIEPNLYTSVDPALFSLVLENLLDNACKFSVNRDRPEIQFGRDEVSFYVEDNGIGFDSRYADRIFEPFERLDPNFSGSGIGLANVRRIVARHHGRVWAESAPGVGTTIRFTVGTGVGRDAD